MKTIGTKHPMIFGTVLFFVTILAAGVLSAVMTSAGMTADASGAIARIVIALILLVLFRDCFHGHPFAGLAAVLPGLVFAAWNLYYHRAAGIPFRTDELMLVVLCSTAPAVYEEVLFRGILVDRLRKNGQTCLRTMVLSALLFALVHLTNITGLGTVSTLVQTVYAFVIGLLFAAFRLKGCGLGSLMLVHALIDFTSQIHTEHPVTTSIPLLVLFAAILAAASVYAFAVVPKNNE